MQNCPHRITRLPQQTIKRRRIEIPTQAVFPECERVIKMLFVRPERIDFGFYCRIQSVSGASSLVNWVVPPLRVRTSGWNNYIRHRLWDWWFVVTVLIVRNCAVPNVAIIIVLWCVKRTIGWNTMQILSLSQSSSPLSHMRIVSQVPLWSHAPFQILWDSFNFSINSSVALITISRVSNHNFDPK